MWHLELELVTIHATPYCHMLYFILVLKGLLHETAPFLIRLMIEKDALMLLKVCQHFVHLSCAEKLHPRSSLESSWNKLDSNTMNKA